MEQKQYFFSPELAHRFGALDIGTNSIRLIIAEALRGGDYRVLDDEKESTRLGRNLAATGSLDPVAVEESLQALLRMKQIATGYQVRELRVIATCAVREAEDGSEFVRRAKEEAGVEIEVISSEHEAHLAFHSVARNFDLMGKNVAVADIGGGSTEIILASGNMIEGIFSTPLGAVRMTESYNELGRNGEAYDEMIEGIDRTLRKHTRKSILNPHLLIGTGGTFTTLAEMVKAARNQTGLPSRGYEVTHAQLSHLLDRLRKMPLKARRNVPGLSPDRSDIIVAGLTIIDRLLHRFELNRLLVHDGGVRDGLLLTMIEQSLGQRPDGPHDRDAALERLAQGCGVDIGHCRQVSRLAGEIFAQLAPSLTLNPGDRALVEAAAIVQDVGYLINYDKHHKHSYHLILNSRLPGFQPKELELIANVARYHRGSGPRKKHENYRQLAPEDQLRVRQMASILRLAIGLDRSHTQSVQTALAHCEDGQVTVAAVADEVSEVDLWGVRKRSALFEETFGVKLLVEWQKPAREAKGKQAAATP